MVSFFTDKKKQGDRINRGEELLNVEFEGNNEIWI